MTSVLERSPNAALGTKRAIIYDRVSTLQQSKAGYSGGADGFQIEDCTRHAERQGYDVVANISDVDSGAEWEIDGIMDVIDRAKRREYDVLIVAHSSRFARNLGKKLVYEADLRRHGVSVEYLNIAADDSPTGRLMSHMVGAFDEYERELIAFRMQKGIKQKAARGLVVGSGPVTYGYAYLTEWVDSKKRQVPRGLVIRQDTAAVVRRIFADSVHLSAEDIAVGLTTERVPTPTGRRLHWGASTVRAIVRQSAYRGAWTYDGQTVNVPPIVSDAEWYAAQAATRRRQVSRKGRARSGLGLYELRGLLACGHCGGPLSTWVNTTYGVRDGDGHGRHRTYLCQRHLPSRARQRGQAVCDLPMLLASSKERGTYERGQVGLEEEAWRIVMFTMLDPEQVRRRLGATSEQTRDARADRAARLATLDAAIALETRKATNAATQLLPLTEDDALYGIFTQAARDANETIARLVRDRAALAALPEPGISQARAEAIMATVRKLAAGAARATAAERRGLYELIGLRAVVTKGGGVLIGGRGQVRIAWEALIPLASEQYQSRFCALSNVHGRALTLIDDAAAAASFLSFESHAQEAAL